MMQFLPQEHHEAYFTWTKLSLLLPTLQMAQIRVSQTGPSAHLGGHGTVLWGPQAEAFT